MTAAPAVELNLRLPAPDGVLLATDVVRPGGRQAVPVVVLRTPHGKSSHLDEALAWARAGFACVLQDVRGRNDSDGVWEPYRYERGDSAALVDWLAEQRWVSRIVAYGGSYAAFTAWCAAVERPGLICRVISLVPAMGLHRVKFHPSGILRLDEHVGWWLTHCGARTSRPAHYRALLAAEPDVLRHLPVAELGDRFWARLPAWSEILDGGRDDAPPWAIGDDELAGVAAPSLHVGGWHDLLVDETLHQWRIAGSHLTPRPSSSLLVGPWTHRLGAEQSSIVGVRDYGPASLRSVGSACLRWLRDLACDDQPRDSARVFLMGDNAWLDGAGWPPPVTSVRYFASADGGLSPDVPETGGSDRFRYDPEDPFPSEMLPVDVSSSTARRDAVRYTTRPLAEPLRIAGVAHADLHVTTDVPATDWIARLLEVTHDGCCVPITWGAVPSTGREATVTVPMTPTATALAEGSRLRLEITSSYFPELARSLNRPGSRYRGRGSRVADQVVHWGAGTPTALRLPTCDEPA